MRGRRALTATAASVATAALLGVAGCSDASSTSSGGDPSTQDSSSAATSSPAESPEESSGEPTGESTDLPSGSPGAARSYAPRPVPDRLPRTRIEAANLHYAYLGDSAARTAEEKAVVEAWMSYWQGAADSYYLYRPTELFDSVARGSARRTVVDYLDTLKAKKQRVMGYSVENVSSVDVDGTAATVRDCTESFTFLVDRESEPMSRVKPYYDTTGTLKKTDGKWTVVTLEDDGGSHRSCLD
jgi:hypothetical protein